MDECNYTSGLNSDIIQDKKHGFGWIIYPDGSQYTGEFIHDEPVEMNGSGLAAENRATTDEESINSLKTEHSWGSATIPLSPKSSKSADTGKLVRHDRNRSFVKTVGRKI